VPGGETGIGGAEQTVAGMITEASAGHVTERPADRVAEPEKPALSPRILAPRILVGLLLALVIGVFLICLAGCKMSPDPNAFQDLGKGISNATGLKGSLKTRWDGKAAQYQLEIEPIDPLQSAGFSYVTANPPGPLSLHIKLLDATGYAVCGKDVFFPFGRLNSGQADRESGQDVLQTAIGDDGKVVSLSAQGILPCTPAQYKQADYWDFSTDFPTLAEQDALRRRPAELKAKLEAQKRALLERQKAGLPAFYMEGDDQADGYDASHEVLQTRNKSFLVAGQGQQTTASLWASTGVLIRYKCDQRALCVLTKAGGGQSLSVTALQ
jgi:hypothetical protein